MTTAAETIARSERTAFTHQLGYLPWNVFTADVVLAGCEFEYVFQGDLHDLDTAVALGRVRRIDTNDYRATLADGRVIAEHTTRRTALRKIAETTNAMGAQYA